MHFTISHELDDDEWDLFGFYCVDYQCFLLEETLRPAIPSPWEDLGRFPRGTVLDFIS